jgi:alkylhydroperoxidase/carboxymuconolactone decarboxylase family protein YurZ
VSDERQTVESAFASEHFSFSYEEPIHEAFPRLHAAQSEWLSAIESLSAPDRKTHELIRLVCAVISRSTLAVERHARLAREVGATWPDVLGTIMLTTANFGILPAVEAIPVARKGFDAAEDPETD